MAHTNTFSRSFIHSFVHWWLGWFVAFKRIANHFWPNGCVMALIHSFHFLGAQFGPSSSDILTHPGRAAFRQRGWILVSIIRYQNVVEVNIIVLGVVLPTDRASPKCFQKTICRTKKYFRNCCWHYFYFRFQCTFASFSFRYFIWMEYFRIFPFQEVGRVSRLHN